MSSNEPPRLPGLVDGLVRRCSPVTFWSFRNGATLPYLGVVAEVDSSAGRATVGGLGALVGSRWLDELELYLGDMTGRLHAVAWIMEGLRKRPGPPSTSLGFRWDPHRGLWFAHDELTRWFFGPVGDEHGVWAQDGVYEPAGDVVPFLDDLDPHDDTRLPDGSRWVEAEALRRVVLWLAILRELRGLRLVRRYECPECEDAGTLPLDSPVRFCGLCAEDCGRDVQIVKGEIACVPVDADDA